MSREPPVDVESCTELNLEDSVPEFALGPELHDTREVEQSLRFDVHQCAAYVVTNECRECSMSWKGVKIMGETPGTAADFNRVVYDLYESCYENPRSISHLLCQRIAPAPADEPRKQERFAGFLNDAIALGCRDADNDRRKRTQQEVLEYILPKNLRVL